MGSLIGEIEKLARSQKNPEIIFPYQIAVNTTQTVRIFVADHYRRLKS